MSSAVLIFKVHLKIVLIENSFKVSETELNKAIDIIDCIEFYKKIFNKSIALFEIISEVSESDILLTDDAFLFVYWYGLKMGIQAYKAIVDYSSMIIEIMKNAKLGFMNIDKILTSIDTILEECKTFHLNISIYQYFLKDNGITECDNFKEDGNKYSKKSLSLIKNKLLLNIQDQEEDISKSFQSFNHILETNEEMKKDIINGSKKIVYLHTIN